MPLADLPLGSTFPMFGISKNSDYSSLDRISAGLLLLGTLSIQAGTSNLDSMSKIRSIRRSLSSLADQLLRNDPLTASLSVKSTTRRQLRSTFQLLRAPRTAIISSYWIMVRCPLDVMPSMTFSSTSTLKRDRYSPSMFMANPPGPL